MIVLNNFNDLICAGVAVNYYWTSKIENIRIFCHTLGHNIGTMAMTLFLLPTYLIKICFGWIDWFTSSEKPNSV